MGAFAFFERPGLRCPERPCSFLWIFRWLDYHKTKLIPGSVKRWGAIEWRLWQFAWRCQACGVTCHESGMNEGRLRRIPDVWAEIERRQAND